MREDESSGTALAVTAIRAAHQLIDDIPPILADPVSLRLVDSGLTERMIEEPGPYRAQPAKALRSHVVLRGRYAEDALFEACQSGIEQFISLGAGYDTFAYRQPPWARGLNIFEIDHPATQAAKLELLNQRKVEIPENVAFLPLDLEKESLGARLVESRFDPSLPALVACLGVLAYLRSATVHRIVKSFARLPKSSRFVFTFASKGPSALSDRTAARGEPWRARFEPEEIEKALLDAGFGEVRFLLPEEAAERYYAGRSDLPPPRKVTMGQGII